MNKCVLWMMCCMIVGISSAQTARYSVVINEFLADPTPAVGLPNTEFIELKNTSNKAIQLEKWRIENSSTSSTINTTYLLQPDSLVVICSKTQTSAFNLPGKTIGISSFPTLANESGMIILKDASGKTIHAVSYDQSWYRSPTKSEGGWSLEMIDPTKPCDDNNWQTSVNDVGGTPGKENSIYRIHQTSGKINALQCTAINPTMLLLQLNKGADSLSLSTTEKYSLLNNDIQIVSAHPITPLFNKVELLLTDSLHENNIYQLELRNLAHCNEGATDSMIIFTGLRKPLEKEDLLINEILFDPEPGGTDFLEVFNKSNSVIDANELFLSSKNSTGSIGKVFQATEEHFNIFPGDHLVLTTDTGYVKREWMASAVHMIQMSSMPSMPDDKGNILILDKQGDVIDELNYSRNMHFPLLNSITGVSLERINVASPSSNIDNWHSASSTVNYATPTRKNSQHLISDNLESKITILPDVISPNNDGVDDILKIDYNFPNNGSLLSIHVYDYNGRLITKIADNLLCGTKGAITWNGLDKQNRKPNTGLYIIYAESFNLNGSRSRTKKAIGLF